VDLPVDRRKLRGIFAPVLPRALIPVNQTHTVTALTDNLFSRQQSMRHRQPQWLAQRDNLPHTLGINTASRPVAGGALRVESLSAVKRPLCALLTEKHARNPYATPTPIAALEFTNGHRLSPGNPAELCTPSGSIGIDGRQSPCIHSNVQQRARVRERRAHPGRQLVKDPAFPGDLGQQARV
jgi:hypothetical protein